MLTVCRRCAAAYAYLFFIRKGCCMKRCAAALWEVPPLRMPTKQRKHFSIYALRPARPLPALFSLRTKSFWCLRWLGVG